jgi:hypothetical protein
MATGLENEPPEQVGRALRQARSTGGRRDPLRGRQRPLRHPPAYPGPGPRLIPVGGSSDVKLRPTAAAPPRRLHTLLGRALGPSGGHRSVATSLPQRLGFTVRRQGVEGSPAGDLLGLDLPALLRLRTTLHTFPPNRGEDGKICGMICGWETDARPATHARKPALPLSQLLLLWMLCLRVFPSVSTSSLRRHFGPLLESLTLWL